MRSLSAPLSHSLWPAQLHGAGPCVLVGKRSKHRMLCRSSHAESNSAASSSDPRLKWANPEWLAPLQQQEPQQLRKPASGINSSGRPSAMTLRQSKLLKRVTYGSAGSSSSSNSSSSITHINDDAVSWKYSSTERDGPGGSNCDHDPGRVNPSYHQRHEQLYQAMGIDYGTQRLGLAIRSNDSNVPLITLHRQQPLAAGTSGSIDGRGTITNSTGKGKQQNVLISQCRAAAAVLHLALEEGCDGFVIGLPQGVEQIQKDAGHAPAAADAKFKATATLCAEVRGFAQKLAGLASGFELPVLLVNEQQSSQQARAIMSGAAAYDVKVMQQLEEQQRTQLQQPVQGGADARALVQAAYRKLGRDAFAAALILSRYYNGLVLPEMVSVNAVDGGNSGSDNSGNSNAIGAASRQSGRSFTDEIRQQAAADLEQMQQANFSSGRHCGKNRKRQKMVAPTN